MSLSNKIEDYECRLLQNYNSHTPLPYKSACSLSILQNLNQAAGREEDVDFVGTVFCYLYIFTSLFHRCFIFLNDSLCVVFHLND